ncbi:protein HGH1 homolog [Mya arenaria]|uniref:protein HGH1 homolog n=1 Tax=Mya arenaria TaxID=6604 RepID=UPI0022E8578A|nr:protein HGH1 homolog [Mya arenaria]
MDKELLEKELAPFLDPSTKEDVKTVAVENVKGLTGTVEGKTFLCESEKLLSGIVSLTNDKRTDIKEMVLKALINIAADENSSWTILNLKNYEKKVCDWLEEGLNPKCKYADLTCKLVSNLTRYEKCADYVGKLVLKEKSTIGIDKIVLALCNIMHNDNADLHYLGAILSNLSQSREVRKHIMDKEQCIIQRLLPFTEFRQSEIRRAGIVGTLKNCCFDTEYHDWLLGDQVDILPRLLLPLAGPDEFDDDDMERLPDDLQYLPEDKEREPIAPIRKMLCEALLQLCATRAGKKYIKDKNTYVIMREYFKWEREMDPVNEIAAMNVIDMMIGDEPTEEFGENLKDVDIPEDVLKRFHEDDRKEREFAEKERQEKLAEMKELKTKGNS